jgi:hypothetical protein
MLLTLGGFGIWAFVDFFYYLFMNYTDIQSDYVTRNYNRLLLLLVPLTLIFALSSWFYPQYLRDLKLQYETQTVKSLTNFIMSQKVFLKDTGFYSPSLKELHTKFYLEPQANIIYSDIVLFDTPEERHCYWVSLKHKFLNMGIMTNSCGKTTKVYI